MESGTWRDTFAKKWENLPWPFQWSGGFPHWNWHQAPEKWCCPFKKFGEQNYLPGEGLGKQWFATTNPYLEYFTNTLEPPKDGQPVKRTCCLLRVLGALTLKIGYHDVLRLGYHILVVPILAMQWYFMNLALASSNFVQNVHCFHLRFIFAFSSFLR